MELQGDRREASSLCCCCVIGRHKTRQPRALHRCGRIIAAATAAGETPRLPHPPGNAEQWRGFTVVDLQWCFPHLAWQWKQGFFSPSVLAPNELLSLYVWWNSPSLFRCVPAVCPWQAGGRRGSRQLPLVCTGKSWAGIFLCPAVHRKLGTEPLGLGRQGTSAWDMLTEQKGGSHPIKADIIVTSWAE